MHALTQRTADHAVVHYRPPIAGKRPHTGLSLSGRADARQSFQSAIARERTLSLYFASEPYSLLALNTRDACKLAVRK
jgi:hypothetical protein